MKKAKNRKKNSQIASPKEIVKFINDIRFQFGLPVIKSNPIIEEYANKIAFDKGAHWIHDESTVILSIMKFTEPFDEKSSTEEIISHWMNSPSKRSVLLAPGNHGVVLFVSNDVSIQISIVIIADFSADLLPIS